MMTLAIDPELQALIGRRCATARTRVFALHHGGRKFWVKTAGNPRLRSSLLLQRCLSILFGLAMLKPPRQCNGAAGLHQEAAAIRQLAAVGVAVPAVIAAGESWLLLEDAGSALEAELNRLGDSDERWHRIRTAGALLSQLHGAGLWHGGAQIRNFSWRDGVPGLLDFEDHDLPGMALPERQARDLLLFLYSLTRYDREPEAPRLHELTAAMVGAAGVDTRAALAKFLRRTAWLLAIGRLIAPWAGRDVRQAVAAELALGAALAAHPEI